MEDEEVIRRLNAYGDEIRKHESAIAVLSERAEVAQRDRLALWDKKEAHDNKLDELRRDLAKQHQELMAAITANKTAASILSGERGAGKWIAGFIATLILTFTGLGTLVVNAFRWFSAG